MIYFDNAATSYNRPSCVKEAVAAAIDAFGNPSRGAYSASLDADRCLLETRMQLAALAGAEGPDCVAFTMNATQALNTAILGLGLQAGDHLIVSLQEHNSVLRPAYRLRERGIVVHFVGLKADARLDMEDLEQTLRTIRTQSPDARIAVALSHGSNVTGNVIDLSRVSALCNENRATWILDAAQTMGIIPINMRRLGIDILCFSGHKALMGPQGTGAIIVRRGINLSPLMAGGSGIRTFLETMPQEMPEHLEAGTQNAHSIAGLHAALAFAEGKRETWRAQALGLRKQLLSGIDAINRQAGEERIHVYGREEAGNPAQAGSQDESGPVLPTVAFNIGHLEAADVADRLWRDRQIAVRAGGHCAPLIHRFFGTEKRGIVRASFSHANTPGQVQTLIEELKKIERSL